MRDASGYALVSGFRSGFRLPADPLDLDRIRTCKAHAVAALANAGEIAAPRVHQSREVPILKAAAAIFEMDVSHQVFHPLQLIVKISPTVVIADVAGVIIQPDGRMVHLSH